VDFGTTVITPCRELSILLIDINNLFVSWLIFRFICNKYLLKPGVPQDNRVEWGYCFDVHLNALFPLLVLLHGVVILLYHGKYSLLTHLSSVDLVTHIYLHFKIKLKFTYVGIYFFFLSGNRTCLDNFHGIRKHIMAHGLGLLHLYHLPRILVSPATSKYQNILVPIDHLSFGVRRNPSPGLEHFHYVDEFLPVSCIVINDK